MRLWQIGDANLRHALAPVLTLLAQEHRAVQRVRERVFATSPLASVVLVIVVLNNERMQRYIRQRSFDRKY